MFLFLYTVLFTLEEEARVRKCIQLCSHKMVYDSSFIHVHEEPCLFIKLAYMQQLITLFCDFFLLVGILKRGIHFLKPQQDMLIPIICDCLTCFNFLKCG